MQFKLNLNIKRIKDILPNVVLVTCIFVFIGSLFMIAKNVYAYYHDDAQYQKLREQVSSDHSSKKFDKVFSSPLPEKSQSGQDAKTPPLLPYMVANGDVEELDKNGILSDYSALKSQNQDLMGWIRMPGFKKSIDYPVMQNADREFYLTHDFYKNDSQAGSIFMDERNNPNEVDSHIILYGHAMKDMSMFGNLKEFPGKPSDHTKNTRIYLDLMNTRLEYEVFSTYYVDENYNYRQTSFSSNEEYAAFLDRIRLMSVYDYKIKLTDKDKIITLSTCNGDLGANIRSVTHARLIRQIVYDGASNIEPIVTDKEQSSKEVVSANVYLKQLSLEYGDAAKPEKAVLDPAFLAGLKEFITQLPSEVETARLFFETADPDALVEVTLNGQKADMNSLKLAYGENIIKIKIISRDKKYSRSLTVTATRTPVAEPTVSPTTSSAASPDVYPSPSPTISPDASPSPSPAMSPDASPTPSPTVSATVPPELRVIADAV
ncbi:MAG: class B sortase [Ruminiclostridium sp.]|nr:class B sortase [Ruminiclostridium sp.]